MPTWWSISLLVCITTDTAVGVGCRWWWFVNVSCYNDCELATDIDGIDSANIDVVTVDDADNTDKTDTDHATDDLFFVWPPAAFVVECDDIGVRGGVALGILAASIEGSWTKWYSIGGDNKTYPKRPAQFFKKKKLS